MRDWLTIELVLAALLVTSFTCVGLVALWAATSPRQWFVRCAVVFVVLSPLLLIPAYEPFVAFLIQTAVVAVGALLYRWTLRRSTSDTAIPRTSRRMRFSLSTLLLVTVLASVAVTIAVRLPRLNLSAWSTVVLNGVTGGFATIMGGWMHSTNRKPFVWPIAIGLCGILGGITSMYDWFIPSIVEVMTGWPPDLSGAASILGVKATSRPVMAWIFIPILAAIFISFLLQLWHLGFQRSYHVRPSTTHPLAQSMARGAGTILIVFIAALPLYVLIELLTPDSIPKTPLPEPNAYHDFIAAGKMINRTQFDGTLDVATATAAQLSVEIPKCKDALQLVATALEKPCVVPVDYSPSGVSLPMEDIVARRPVVRALYAQGRLAELENRHVDAADAYMRAIRFGYSVRRGGLLVDALIGIACSRTGAHPLYHLRDKMDGEQLEHCIAELLRLDANDESYADIWQRDRVWTQRAGGWHSHLTQLLGEIVDHVYEIGFIMSSDQYPGTHSVHQATIRLLIVELALQRFHQMHSGWPESLSELVPKHLAAIPADPFNPAANPFQYCREGNKYVLYSVVNLRDDGGEEPAEGDFPGVPITGDLRLNIHFASED